MYDVWTNPSAARLMNGLRLEIVDGGYARLNSVWSYHGVCSPYCRLYLVREGAGVVRAGESGEAQLRPGYVCLIPASVTFDHWCDAYLEKLYFHFNLLLSDGGDLFARHGRILETPLSTPEIDRLSALYRSERAEDLLALQAELFGLLTRFIRQEGLGALASKSYSSTVSRVFPLLQRDLSSKTTVRSLAQALNVSESTLTKRFRAEVGAPLGGYIDAMLLQRARQLLLTSDLTIGQISEQLRFCDQFYFSRYFRQRQGVTPSEYRRSQKHLT